MATASARMTTLEEQDIQNPITSIASLSDSGEAILSKNIKSTSSGSISMVNNDKHNPTRFKSERRPSFSITLPPSSPSRNNLFNSYDADDSNRDERSERGSTISGQLLRPSVQFLPDEDDILMNHEGKHGLPKTPYPTTGEEEEWIHSLLFKH